MEKKQVMKLAFDALEYQRNAVHAGLCSIAAEATAMHLEFGVEPDEFKKREASYDAAIAFRTDLIQTFKEAQEFLVDEYTELFDELLE